MPELSEDGITFDMVLATPPTDIVIAGVPVRLTFAGKTYAGVTDNNGWFVTSWITGLTAGAYYANADISASDYYWARYLDAPDDSDDDPLGLPDALLTI